MKKVCLIGNSHLGVLRSAWENDLSDQYTGFDFTYFGAAGAGLGKVVCEGGYISPNDDGVRKSFLTTSGGENSIAIENYDAFILHGVGFPLKAIYQMLHKVSCSLNDSRQFVSSGCLEACFESVLEAQPFKMLFDYICDIVPAPVIVSMAPMWSELEVDNAPDQYSLIVDQQNLISTCFLNALNTVFPSNKARILLQQADTKASEFFSKKQYSMGYASHNIRDFGHMNNEYGAIVVKNILLELEELSTLAA
jgi:hypothetical protein